MKIRQTKQSLQRPGSWGDPERACCLFKGSEVLPGPPKPPSVAELSQDSTALSTLGTAGENRAATRPPLSASGGSSSASLASLKLPDLRGGGGPRRKRRSHYHWPMTSKSQRCSASFSFPT